MSKVKADDPCNLLIRTQFCNWPKEHLVHIYASGEPEGKGEFCGHYYRLKGCDRIFGGVFQRLRGGVFDMVVMNTVEEQDNDQQKKKLARRTKLIKKRFGDWLIGSGEWEVIFHVRLSTLMAKFVNDFKPDIIYCQGYSLGFATLPMMIASRFSLPICFQTTDDWPSYTYRSFPMAGLLRQRTQQLITNAKVRMAFGEKMQRLYESRYGERFEVMYHLDDPQRFIVVSAVDNDQARITKQYRIVYTGTLALRRYEALQDLLVVVRLLAKK